MSRSVCFCFFVFSSCFTACFSGSFSDDARVFCDSDADCPAGARCQADHLCKNDDVDVDLLPPRLRSATFAPSAINVGQVTLTLVADEALADDVDPVLVFAGEALALPAPARPAADTIAYSIEVDDTVAESFIALTQVTLADQAGNTAASPSSAVLHVDRTPPRVAALTVVDEDPSPGVLLADVLRADDFTASALVDEAVARVTATLGSDALACTADNDALAITCTGAVRAGVNDGENTLNVVVEDLAGNVALASTTVRVDLRAPQVIPGTVRVLVDGVERDVAALGQTIVVEVVVDEAVGDNVSAVLATNPPLAFGNVVEDGQVLSFSLVVSDVPGEGEGEAAPVGIVLTVDDQFAHSASSEVARVRLVAFPEGPCAAFADRCVDVDGDGFFGASAGCPVSARSDCDDSAALVFPGAREVFADGVINDCDDDGDAADILPNGGAVIFLAPTTLGGAPDAPGTRTDPLSDLTVALERARAEGLTVALREGFYEYVGELDVPLYGGFEDESYRIRSGRSVVQERDSLEVEVRDIAVGLDVQSDAVFFFANSVFVDGATRGLARITGPARLTSVDVGGGLIVDRSAQATRLLDVAIGFSARVDANDVTMVGVTVEGGVNISGGALTFVNGALRGTSRDELFLCDACTALTVVHSNLVASSPAGFRFVDSAAPLVVTSNVLQLRNDAALLVVDDSFASLAMRNNLLSFSGGALIQSVNGVNIANDDVGLAELNACTFATCETADANRGGTARLDPQDVRRLAAAASDVDDAGARMIEPPGSPVSLLAPPEAFSDVDGQCRARDNPDIGADER